MVANVPSTNSDAQGTCTKTIHPHCFVKKTKTIIWHVGSKCAVTSSAKSLSRITLLFGSHELFKNYSAAWAAISLSRITLEGWCLMHQNLQHRL